MPHPGSFSSISTLLGNHSDSTLPWIGMGCQAFGGTLTPRGSRRALEKAREEGIVYYDVARSYGFGQAEQILGKFIRPWRDQVYLATKIGETPRQLTPIGRFLRQRFARTVRSWLPKKPVRRSTSSSRSGASSFRGRRFTPAEVEQSLQSSLKAVGTDYFDIVHLHSADADALTDDVMERLEAFRQKGAIRLLGLATSIRDTNRILNRYQQFDVIQISDQATEPGIEKLDLGGQKPGLITHSILGRSGDLRAHLAKQLELQPDVKRSIQKQLGEATEERLHSVHMLIRCALARNANGVVLCGMNRPEHIADIAQLMRLPTLPPTVLTAVWESLQSLLRADEN